MNTISVSGIACPCEGTPHGDDGDTVELRERLDLPGGARLQQLVTEANNIAAKARIEKRDVPYEGTNAHLAAQLAEAYMHVGVVAWTFLDRNGKPLPVTSANIDDVLVSDFIRSQPVAEKADDLYLGPVLGPLVRQAVSSSPSTPTERSTSATSNGSGKSRKQSRQSSTTTIPTDDTTTTSP